MEGDIKKRYFYIIVPFLCRLSNAVSDPLKLGVGETHLYLWNNRCQTTYIIYKLTVTLTHFKLLGRVVREHCHCFTLSKNPPSPPPPKFQSLATAFGDLQENTQKDTSLKTFKCCTCVPSKQGGAKPILIIKFISAIHQMLFFIILCYWVLDTAHIWHCY